MAHREQRSGSSKRSSSPRRHMKSPLPGNATASVFSWPGSPSADSGTPVTNTDPLYVGTRTSSGKPTDRFKGAVDLVRLSSGAVYSSNFFTILALLVVLFLVPMAYVAVSAIVLPYRRPALFGQSPVTGKFLGIPWLSWAGALGLAASLFVFWIFMKYPALGVSNRKNTVLAMIGLMVGGFLLYYVARAVQRARGVDIELNYHEIPPE